MGEWEVEEPFVYKAIEGDKGLVAKNAAAHHAMSSLFKTPINPKGKDLVVQYEVKLQGTLALVIRKTNRQLIQLFRWPTVRWCIHEATTREQEIKVRGVLERLAIRDYVRS